MIDPEFCRVMARYNAWQNTNLNDAAATLDDAALRVDRGAFFGSILGTMNHLLWGDVMWMSRFDGWTPPDCGIADSPGLHPDFDSHLAARGVADTRIADWAARLVVGDLEGDLCWYSGAMQAHQRKPLWLCVQHFFNHQTHHRGQIHAMLTAAGARPGATDLFAMPDPR